MSGRKLLLTVVALVCAGVGLFAMRNGVGAETPLTFQTKVTRNLSHADADSATRFACMGDSIANYACRLDGNSFISRALFTINRRWLIEPMHGSAKVEQDFGNFAVTGSKSGTRTCPNDMNCPERLSAVAAFNPDILFIMVGRNENASGSAETVANIRAAVDRIVELQPQNRLRAVIVVPVLPGNTGVSTPLVPMNEGQVKRTRQMRQALLDLARADPLYHIFDLTDAFTDARAPTYQPVGGFAGGKGAVLMDGVHMSQFGARLAAEPFNRMLDQLAVKPLSPEQIARAPLAYDGFAHARPGQSKPPAGFAVTSNDPELAWQGKFDADPSAANPPHVAYQLTISAAAPLAADRSVSLVGRVPIGALETGHVYGLAMHARIAPPCAGMTNLTLTFAYKNETGQIVRYRQDARPTRAALDSDLLDLRAPEDRHYQIAAMTIRQRPVADAQLSVVAEFKSGSQPDACVIRLSDLLLYAV